MKKITNKIEKFLKERRVSKGGGWAAITENDINSLNNIIHDLIEAKCEPDADGDYPLQVILVNRRKYEPLRFEPLPYVHMLKDKKEQEAWFVKAMDNMRIASDVITSYLRSYYRQ